MCGIGGLAGRRPVNGGTVAAMLGALAHRGPDDEGTWRSTDGKVILGSRRLAVLDPTPAGHQPMSRGNLTIAYNGEIYNYIELAERLKHQGAMLRSRSDTEVLLAAYERWGDKCVDELNGMFAFAIYDGDRNRLFCARDRFGEKPFLFRTGPDHFAFASEYKALLSVGEKLGTIDEVRLARFLVHPSQGLDDEMTTVFGGVSQLPPAHTLSLDLDTLTWRVARYWDATPDSTLLRLSDGDAQAQFRELLTDAVRLRLRSDVPQGSCLSGGLDSSAIVCIARQLLGQDCDYDTFTGKFPGSAADESAWAHIVHTAARTRWHAVEPTADGLLAEIGDFVWMNELPTGSASQYAQWCVFRLAKQHGVTVLLDGQGGDELLGGYEQYFEPYLASLPADRAAAERTQIEARYPVALLTPRQRLGRALPRRLAHAIAGVTGLGSDAAFGLAWDIARRIDEAPFMPRDARFHPLADALHRDMTRRILPVLLRYGDRNSMAHSREVRLPFCDHRLAEFVFSLAPQRLMGGAETKRLLRGAMAGVIPEAIRTRWNKQGFLPPQAAWFRGSLGPAVRDIVQAPDFARSGLWRADWWHKVLARFDRGDDHLSALLWRPFMEHMWRVHFVERVRRQPVLPVFADRG